MRRAIPPVLAVHTHCHEEDPNPILRQPMLADIHAKHVARVAIGIQPSYDNICVAHLGENNALG